MNNTQAVELAMHIDTVGKHYGIRVVNGSGFNGVCGLCFAVEKDNERRLVTCEEDWKKIAREWDV
jgi:hypothetical protein